MRLIDADAVVAMTATCPKEMDIDSFIEGMGVVLDRVYDAPTVDAVQVVRCKECAKRGTINCDLDYCGYRQADDWYCADGERKDDESEN